MKRYEMTTVREMLPKRGILIKCTDPIRIEPHAGAYEFDNLRRSPAHLQMEPRQVPPLPHWIDLGSPFRFNDPLPASPPKRVVLVPADA